MTPTPTTEPATKPKRRMPQPGEYIDLIWDSTPDEEFVRGHVTADAFAAAFDRYHKSEKDGPPTPPDFQVTHKYARWSMEVSEDGPRHMLRTYAEPGRGRFAITEACYHAVRRAAWPEAYV